MMCHDCTFCILRFEKQLFTTTKVRRTFIKLGSHTWGLGPAADLNLLRRPPNSNLEDLNLLHNLTSPLNLNLKPNDFMLYQDLLQAINEVGWCGGPLAEFLNREAPTRPLRTFLQRPMTLDEFDCLYGQRQTRNRLIDLFGEECVDYYLSRLHHPSAGVTANAAHSWQGLTSDFWPIVAAEKSVMEKEVAKRVAIIKETLARFVHDQCGHHGTCLGC